MRRFAKRTAQLFALLLVAALALAAHTWFAKPLSINWFYDRAFVQAGLDMPEALTYVGFLEQFGIRGHNAKWNDESAAAQEREFAQARAHYETFQRYDVSALKTTQEKISHAVFDRYLREKIESERWRFHGYPISQLHGAHISAPNLLTHQQPLTNAADAQNFIARLDGLPLKFEQILDDVKVREQKGIVPPRFAIDKAIEQMRNISKDGAKSTPIYKTFVEKLAKVDSLSPAQREAFAEQAQASIGTRVIPAYEKMIAHFTALQAKVTRNDGVWSLPDGEAYYQHEINTQTTTTMTAAQIHALGLSEVARIRTQMDARLTELGFIEGTLPQRMAALGKRPDLLYPNTDEGRAQVLKDYQTIIDEIDKALPTQFGRLPKAKVEVKRVPTYSEQSAPGAYYDGPALDGSRPGVFFANLRDANETPKFGMRTLAYHEAVPGHHMQVTIAQELKGLPMFRSFSFFTAYVEGWALYAELLAAEMGFQKAPENDLGRLQDEMLRAVRLVVDTGIHAQRWSRERAIEYMIDNTGMGRDAVVTEIERYFVNPGQALAYKIGMLKILELREKARKALGAKYDQRAFHDAVLTNGALPLTVLEQVIDQLIADGQNRP
jgi:uncharacterized protein (DUF885 family)